MAKVCGCGSSTCIGALQVWKSGTTDHWYSNNKLSVSHIFLFKELDPPQWLVFGVLLGFL